MRHGRFRMLAHATLLGTATCLRGGLLPHSSVPLACSGCVQARRAAVSQQSRWRMVAAAPEPTTAPSGGGRSYDHTGIERKWQNYWEQHRVFAARRREGKQKKYVLDMFPYPSGAGLHVGHPEGYTASDIMARYWRMCDFDVLHPMGWDAFGLPAEQHAINTGTHPEATTKQNIANFKRQLRSLGFSYDWDRELATTGEASRARTRAIRSGRLAPPAPSLVVSRVGARSGASTATPCARHHTHTQRSPMPPCLARAQTSATSSGRNGSSCSSSRKTSPSSPRSASTGAPASAPSFPMRKSSTARCAARPPGPGSAPPRSFPPGPGSAPPRGIPPPPPHRRRLWRRFRCWVGVPGFGVGLRCRASVQGFAAPVLVVLA